MDISNGEKLILVMLSELYKNLKVKSEIDPELVMSSIFGDQTWALKWAYGGLFNDSDTENPKVVDETCDILSMYRVLGGSFNKLPKPDQDRVKTDAYPFSDYISFQGFDGNHDPHISVVSFLVEKLGRFDELKGKSSLNSHSSSTLPHYREMLVEYEAMVNTGILDGLSADQIIKILKGGR